MNLPWPAFCDCAETAVELAQVARAVGLDIEPRLNTAVAPSEAPVWLWVVADPKLDSLVHSARATGLGKVGVACFPHTGPTALHALSADLGLPATHDVEAAVRTAALLTQGGLLAHHAGLKQLPASVRARLPPPQDQRVPHAGSLSLAEDSQVVWVGKGGKPRVCLGSTPVARQVLNVLAAIEGAAPAFARHPARPADREAAQEVLFGPPRRLSDPASKAALLPYGVPVPQEELCSSPSRAASEAARMGFPVRITLTSPDLRAWDQPELVVDGVDNAARVRDVYRQLLAQAQQQRRDARVLGVTVSQTRIARSLLSLRVRPIADSTALAELAFADPHGAASLDHTWLPLPTDARGVARAVQRLQGRRLVLPQGSTSSGETCDRLAAVLSDLYAFLNDFPAEVAEVRVHPLAQLVDGDFEARETCVVVTDAYLRGL